MRDEIKKWHNITLQAHQANMYDSLVWSFNIISESAKAYQFEDNEAVEFAKPMRGYFAMKDVEGKKTKYFIEEKYYPNMPIRVNEHEEMFFKDSARARSVVIRPINVTPFKIKPEKCWDSNHEFVDCIAPFQHSHPDQWLINKLIALMGYIGKTFCGICGPPEFGKSAMYTIINALTQKSPVFQPRSIPGILIQITCDGNMVFDDIHAVSEEVRKEIENFTFVTADNSPVYINGAVKSKNTKPKYDISQQSITFLYNTYNSYKDPEKQFWDNLWKNDALCSRFLRLKFEGKLIEEFDRDFSPVKVAEENKMFYMKIAKHLLYLKEVKLKNSYQLRYTNNTPLDLKGRHKIIYDEIVWMIDLYSDTQDELSRLIGVLNKNIQDYQRMLMGPVPVTINKYGGEGGEESRTFTRDGRRLREYSHVYVAGSNPASSILQLLEGRDMVSIDELENRTGIKDIEGVIADMLIKGVLYQPKVGFVGVLK